MEGPEPIVDLILGLRRQAGFDGFQAIVHLLDKMLELFEAVRDGCLVV